MGRCRFCGEPAGWLQRAHRACREAHRGALGELRRTTAAALETGEDLEQLPAEAARLAAAGRLAPGEVRDVFVSAWEEAVDRFLEDRVLSPEEEKRLRAAAAVLELAPAELDRRGAWRRVVRASVLRDVLAGEIPSPPPQSTPLPFVLQKSERLVWVEDRLACYEERRRRRYVGGYHGVSLRIMRGVYYRIGAFRGHPVETEELVFVDAGAVGFTTKHLYFAGERRRFRLRYDRIVSFEPFSDGLGVFPAAASRRPLVFRGGDGWFLYNLATNLAQV